jgi:N-acetylglucosamine malate deacetylase 1
MKVLAIGAHPDDLEFLCTGTLAKYSRLVHEVAMASGRQRGGPIVDTGEGRDRGRPPPEWPKTRY